MNIKGDLEHEFIIRVLVTIIAIFAIAIILGAFGLPELFQNIIPSFRKEVPEYKSVINVVAYKHVLADDSRPYYYTGTEWEKIESEEFSFRDKKINSFKVNLDLKQIYFETPRKPSQNPFIESIIDKEKPFRQIVATPSGYKTGFPYEVVVFSTQPREPFIGRLGKNYMLIQNDNFDEISLQKTSDKDAYKEDSKKLGEAIRDWRNQILNRREAEKHVTIDVSGENQKFGIEKKTEFIWVNLKEPKEGEEPYDSYSGKSEEEFTREFFEGKSFLETKEFQVKITYTEDNFGFFGLGEEESNVILLWGTREGRKGLFRFRELDNKWEGLGYIDFYESMREVVDNILTSGRNEDNVKAFITVQTEDGRTLDKEVFKASEGGIKNKEKEEMIDAIIEGYNNAILDNLEPSQPEYTILEKVSEVFDSYGNQRIEGIFYRKFPHAIEQLPIILSYGIISAGSFGSITTTPVGEHEDTIIRIGSGALDKNNLDYTSVIDEETRKHLENLNGQDIKNMFEGDIPITFLKPKVYPPINAVPYQGD